MIELSLVWVARILADTNELCSVSINYEYDSLQLIVYLGVGGWTFVFNC